MGQNRELSRFPNAITVLDNGNVGMGTTSFSEGTQPTGTISIIPNSSVSSGPLVQFAGNGRIRPASTGDRLSIDGNALFLNSTFNGNIIMATGGGNVGIGETPSSSIGWAKILTLNGGGAGDTAYILKRTGSAQESAFGTDGANLYIDVAGSTTSTNNNIIFRTANTNSSYVPAERMRIMSSGDVKIGADVSANWSYGGIKVLQIRNGSYYNYSGYSGWSNNIYFNSGWKYYETAGGGYAEFDANGGFSIYTTPSGTANASATLSQRFILSQTGQVTIPDKLIVSAQPSFAAYASQNQEPSSDTILTYNVADVNRGNHYNTSNSRFTAPVAGVYAFGVKVWYKPSTTGTIWVHLRLNGSVYTEQRMSIPTATADFTSFFPKWVLNLAAGDYIEVSGYGNGSNFHSSNTARYSQFYGHLLH